MVPLQDIFAGPQHQSRRGIRPRTSSAAWNLDRLTSPEIKRYNAELDKNRQLRTPKSRQ